MNILLLSNIFPPTTGGSGRWFYEIYRRLSGCDVSVVAGEHSQAEEFDRESELSIQRMDLKFSDWGTFNLEGYRRYQRAVKECNRLVRGTKFDAIHAGSLLPDGWLVRKLAKQRRVPYVVFMHGEETCFATQSRQLKWMGRKILRDASLIIANSENTAQLIEHFWEINPNKVSILNPGVDCQQFQPADKNPEIRNRLGWSDRPVLLTVGRLQPRKGQETMIRAMPELLKTHPKLLYCIVGDGSQRQRLQDLVEELGLGESVQFRTDCDDQEMIECYQQCDLFVLPNREIDGDIEGFGMVLLEAQACGKPVIAGASGGTAETMLIGDTGEIVDCRSIEPLVQAVDKLLSDPHQRERMGQEARQWILSRFDWESLARQASEILSSNRSATKQQPSTTHS